MKFQEEKYTLLYRKVLELGINKDKVDMLIEQIDELANILIDIYLDNKENVQTGDNILQSLNSRTSEGRGKS